MSKEDFTLAGSIFSIGQCGLDDKAEFAKVIEQKKQREVVAAIFWLCERHPELQTDLSRLCDRLELSRSGLMARVNALIKQGYITMEKVYFDKGHRNFYSLKAPREIAIAVSSNPNLEESNQLKKWREDLFKGVPVVDVPERLVAKGDRFLVFALAPALRLGNKGANLTYKRTKVYYGKGSFETEARATEDTILAGVLDMRALASAQTIIRHRITNVESGEPTDRGFVIEMRDICRIMGLPDTAPNKNAVFDQLSRWKTTEFVIRSVSNKAIDFASEFYEIDVYFNVIDELTVQHATRSGKTAQKVNVVFNPRLLNIITNNSNILTVHDEIMRDRNPSPLLHLLYYWLRSFVRHRWDEAMTISARQLHAQLRREVPFSVFQRELLNLLEKRPRRAPGVAALPGYLVAYDKEKGEIHMKADPDDQVVGRQSLLETQVRRLAK